MSRSHPSGSKHEVAQPIRRSIPHETVVVVTFARRSMPLAACPVPSAPAPRLAHAGIAHDTEGPARTPRDIDGVCLDLYALCDL
jgi:hypothetical protein